MAEESFEELVETLSFLDDWEDRYMHIIDMGKALPGLDDALKTSATKVDGCASQVWIHPQIDGDIFDFRGDSDAIIVRGLIAVLHTLYGGRKMSEIAQIDAQGALGQLGLDEHLSAQRSNGVRAMIGRIQELAQR